jgi:protein phosphatase
MNNKVIKLDLKDDYKIVAISDIHAHGELFLELLSLLYLKDEDHLVILGDFINKGKNSYEALQVIKKISERKNTYVLKGNHEYYMAYLMSDLSSFLKNKDFIVNEPFESIIHSMLRTKNKEVSEFSDLQAVYDYLMAHFEEDFKWLDNLPVILESHDFIFVHGGYHDDKSVDDDEIHFLKYDDYQSLSPVNLKKVVVGHWPVCLLRQDDMTNEPHFNESKNIISIDGGLGVKSTGELNALIIEKNKGRTHYDLEQLNHFPDAIVKKSYNFEEEPLVYIDYPNFEIKVLEKYKKMSLCEHIKTKKRFSVFNGLIKETTDGHCLKTNYINRFLNLKGGDGVKIVKTFEDCLLVKYSEKFGWIFREQI